jgi:copper chaperone for superoxide dismutase
MPSFDHVFTATYGVQLHCESCVDSVKSGLTSVAGITDVQCDIENQIVSVTGTAAPSQVVKAIQSTGRDAIVRGTGQPNSAAVCILESFDQADQSQPVKGLARMVAISSTETLFDITVNGLPKGTYFPSVRTSGDLSDGAMSTGKSFLDLGELVVDGEPEHNTSSLVYQTSGFSGQAFFKKNISISQLIGRSMTVSSSPSVVPNSLVGVIARSAGIWENMKTVCSCSGKTVWQERQDAVIKGIN